MPSTSVSHSPGNTMLSPAKINLGLLVHNRRPEDGYHLISSIFIPISFGDEILFHPGVEGFTTHNELTGIQREDFEKVSERGDPRKNILWKAMELLKSEMGHSPGVELTKRIPPGAGLGGGSSNAGLLLRYALQEYGLDPSRIRAMALSLGADVPFFLECRPMYVTGIGEIMEPVLVGPGMGLLCLSGILINTKAAYADLKRSLQATSPQKSVSSLKESLLFSLAHSRWGELETLANHFEDAVFPRHPELERVKGAFLTNGAAYASLTGSGSAIYALVDSEKDLLSLQKRMEEQFVGFRFVPFRF